MKFWLWSAEYAIIDGFCMRSATTLRKTNGLLYVISPLLTHLCIVTGVVCQLILPLEIIFTLASLVVIHNTGLFSQHLYQTAEPTFAWLQIVFYISTSHLIVPTYMRCLLCLTMKISCTGYFAANNVVGMSRNKLNVSFYEPNTIHDLLIFSVVTPVKPYLPATFELLVFECFG